MKKYLLGAAALLAIAAPSVAAAQNGYVDLSYQSAEADVGGLEADGEGWTLGGATSWGGDGTFGVQLDALVGEAEDSSSYNVGGHLFTRNGNYLFGGFANYGNTDVDGGDEVDAWTVGLEGQYYLSRTTLDAALSYGEGDDIDAEFTGLDLGATHFLTDNFSFSGGVGFGSIEGAGDEADVISYGLGAEYQFASAPISLFGGWQHAEIDDADAEADSLSVGVRYNFGGQTLLERNRSGASLSRGGGLGRFAGLL
ncbi:hypothetical protein [Vitreimonas flagellata]|uniref:hypothetical protein n=1 Tax=Vitreimonas flagellata TaxID=2560861 RepID=UPI001074B556|nr:hypothetical protein [Vitreimonas flagellata]